MTLFRALLCALPLLAPQRGWAGDTTAGSTAMEFLIFDANARAIGMGGAYSALAADSNALLYNPAGLGRVHFYEGTFMHNQYVQGLTQDYLGFAAKQGWGVNANYLHFGDIPRSTLSSPAGVGSRFDIGDYVLGAGYGRTFLDFLSVGGGVKYLRESIDSQYVEGYAGDLGLLYAPPMVPGLTVGLSGLNLGPSIRYRSVRQKLPITARAGAAYLFPFLGNDNTVSADVFKVRNDMTRVAVGGETIFAKRVAFRVGFTNQNDAANVGIMGGVGWRGENLSVDYALTPLGDLGLSHSLSLTYRWGAQAPAREGAAKREPEAPAHPAADPKTAASAPAPEVFFKWAQEAIRNQSWGEARKALDQAAAGFGASDARRVLYNERLGYVALRQGDVDGARAYYTEAIKESSELGLSDATVADAFAGMGICLGRRHHASYALKFLNKALELNPSPETRALVERLIADFKGVK